MPDWVENLKVEVFYKLKQTYTRLRTASVTSLKDALHSIILKTREMHFKSDPHRTRIADCLERFMGHPPRAPCGPSPPETTTSLDSHNPQDLRINLNEVMDTLDGSLKI